MRPLSLNFKKFKVTSFLAHFVVIAAVSLIILFLPWLTFSAGQSCMPNCTLESSGNFTADCESGAMMDYVSCVVKANCDEISTTIGDGLRSAYPDDCAYTDIGELTAKNATGYGGMYMKGLGHKIVIKSGSCQDTYSKQLNLHFLNSRDWQ